MNNRFSQGQCIVITKLNTSYISSKDQYLKVNHVYKQRKNYNCLLPMLDSNGKENTRVHFINPANNYDNECRAATPTEAARYKLLKKPFDVYNNAYLIEKMFDDLDKLEKKL